jgi:hypothetical protein
MRIEGIIAPSPAFDVGLEPRHLGFDPAEHPEHFGATALAVCELPARGAVVTHVTLPAGGELQAAAVAQTGLGGGGYRGCRRGLKKRL